MTAADAAVAIRLATSPFKGLAPFGDTDLDTLLFFGREREREVVVANLIAVRLTVLYGQSGVGKSSLLHAGVAYDLRALARDNLERQGRVELAVAVFAGWSGDPVGGIVEAVGDAVEQVVGERPELDPELPLADALLRLCACLDGTVYLILDQFEDYFLYHGSEDDRFGLELPEALALPGLRVNVLVSIREDALAKLDFFQGRIPKLFANVLRLEHLDRQSARAAIVGPVARYDELVEAERGVEIEPELVEAVLDETAEGRVELARTGRGALEAPLDARRIEAPYLQLVMERLWEEEIGRGSRVLRLATLRELGGATEIVRAHLERALTALPAAAEDVAASIFEHLVTPSGGKIAQRVDDLAHYAGVERETLAPVLAALDRERIVRPVDAEGDRSAVRVEIFHDVLAAAVLGWRARRELAQAQRTAARRLRHLLTLAAGAFVALAIVAGVAVFAWLERDDARAKTRSADAREAAASALAQLPIDPLRSLALAASAARLERTPTTESVLRHTLLTSRLRLVLHAAGPVRSAAFDSGGRRILVADATGVARIFDARSGHVLLTLRHGAPITAAAFDRPGRLVVTAGSDGAARLWDARSGRLAHVLRHRAEVRGVSFGAGGLVVTASIDGSSGLWRADTGRLVRTFRPGGAVRAAVLSSDGRRLVTWSKDPAGVLSAQLFDARTGRLVRALPHRGVTSVGFSPDGRLVVTTSADWRTRLWHARDGRSLRELRWNQGPVLKAAFSPDGRLLATAGADGSARIWNVATGERLLVLLAHANYVVDVAFSPDGTHLATASLDWSARLWRTHDGDLLATFAGDTASVTGVRFSPDGSELVTASADGTARVWDAGAERELLPLGTHAGAVATASFAPDGTTVVSAGPDSARIWSVRDRRLLHELGHGAAILDASFSGDGRLVLTAGADGTARVWDPRSGTLVRELETGGPARRARLDPDGRVAAVAAGRSVTLWDVRTGRRLALPLPAEATDVAWSRDGRLVAAGSADGSVRIWAAPGGRLEHELHAGKGAADHVRFSPDGRLVAAAGADGVARLWSVSTGRLAHELRGHTDAVTDVEFSADGRRLVTASRDHDARTWDVRSGRPLRVLRGHFGAVNGASFSLDGRWVVTAGPLRAGVWDAGSGERLLFLGGLTGALTTVSFSPDGRSILGADTAGRVGVYDCTVCGRIGSLIRLAEKQLAVVGEQPRQR